MWLEDEFECDDVIKAADHDISLIKWSPVDDVLFCCGANDKIIKIWSRSKHSSYKNWVLINMLNGHNYNVKGNFF